MKVYALVDDTGEPRYVGKTKWDGDRRYERHIQLSEVSRYPVHRWLRKRRDEGRMIEFRTLVAASNDVELNDRERFFIKAFRLAGFRLLNLTEGGEGVIPTEETRRKMSAVKKGKPTGRKGIKLKIRDRITWKAARSGKAPWNKGVKLNPACSVCREAGHNRRVCPELGRQPSRRTLKARKARAN